MNTRHHNGSFMVVIGAFSQEELEESSSVPVIMPGESLLRAIVQEKSAFSGYGEQFASPK